MLNILFVRIILLPFLLLAYYTVLVGRVIPEADTRLIEFNQLEFGVENRGAFGKEAPLIWVLDQSATKYTYSSGWLVIAKIDSVWTVCSTIDLPLVKANSFPGSGFYGTDYNPTLKDYNQVYLTQDYEQNTGWEKFGGLGPRWPLWGDTDGDIYKQLGPYGLHIADTVLLSEIQQQTPFAPSFPKNLKAFTVSTIKDLEDRLILELQVFYSLIDEQNSLVTHARLTNLGNKGLDSLYFFHVTDLEINNPETPFTGTDNDWCKLDSLLIDSDKKSVITASSLRGQNEQLLELGNIHQVGLWKRPLNSNGYPVQQQSTALLIRDKARQGFITSIATVGDLFADGQELLPIITSTTTDSLYGDIYSLIGIGPLNLASKDSENSIAELMTATVMTPPDQDPGSINYDLLINSISNVENEVLERDYMTIKKTLDKIDKDKRILYRNTHSGHFYYYTVDGLIINFSLNGHIIDSP